MEKTMSKKTIIYSQKYPKQDWEELDDELPNSEILVFAKRLAELRLLKGISARDMSLSLGQSANYINAIESNKSLPSMKNFFCKQLEAIINIIKL